jgi:hypothetical protein
VEGELIAPPARKVVLEKLADQPSKPPSILIEKWLPYKPRTRRVIYERSKAQPSIQPHNLIIEWEAPHITVDRVCIDLGIVETVPEEYARKYSGELKQTGEIPSICSCHVLPDACNCGALDLKSSKLITTMSSPPQGTKPTVILEGDVQALSLLKFKF